MIKKPKPRQCRVCGCTGEHGCEGGCWWTEEDLCSRCPSEPVLDSDGKKIFGAGGELMTRADLAAGKTQPKGTKRAKYRA